MSAVMRMAQLDLRTVRPYRTQMLTLLVIVPLFASVYRQPAIVPVTLVVILVVVAGYPFAIGDKNDLDTLYGVLPVRRRALVAGRYAYAMALVGIAEVLGTLIALAMGAATGWPLSWPELGYAVVAAFAIFGVLVSFQFPLFFALGYARARLVTILPMFFLMAVVVAVTQAMPKDSITPPSPAALVAIALVGTVALLGASMAVSTRLDARRVR